MVYKKYINRNGKKFGPYYFKSVRNKDGSVNSIYLGKRHPNYNLFILFGVLFLSFLMVSIGFVSYNAFVVSDEIIDAKPIEKVKTEDSIEFTGDFVEIEGVSVEVIETPPEVEESSVDDSNSESIDIKKEIILEEINSNETEDPNEENIVEFVNDTEIEVNISEEVILNESENLTEVILINEIGGSNLIDDGAEVNKSIFEDNVSNLTGINDSIKDLLEIVEISNISISPNKTIETIQYDVSVGKPVKWKKIIILDYPSDNIIVNIPKQATNILITDIKSGEKIKIDNDALTIKKDKGMGVITGGAIIDFGAISGFLTTFTDFFFNIFEITGFAINDKLIEEEREIIISILTEGVEIEYETPGPVIDETIINDIKTQVIVSSDIYYADILAYSEINNSPLKGINLYWIVNGSKEKVNFIGYDLDDDSLVDYIEWIVPNSINQIYEIEITDVSNIFYAPLDNKTASYAISDNTNNSIMDGSKLNKDEFLIFKHKDYGKRFRIKGLFESNNVSLQNLIIRTNDYQTVIDARGVFGVDLTHSIYVPNTVNSGVYVCPNAYTLDDVDSSCSEKITFSYDEANSGTWKSGIYVVVENDSYRISNLTGSGGSEYTPSCGDSITVDTTLAAGLTDCTGHGLSIGAHNIVLDCQGHIIDGDSSSGNGGINLGGYDNVIMKNCVITEFNYGILSWWGATGEHIYNNTIYNMTSRGILISDSNVNGPDDNIIENNTIHSNIQHGIYLNDANRTIVRNNIIYDNENHGIQFVSDVSDTTIFNNTIYDNTLDGINLRGNDNNVTENNIYNNSDEGIHIEDSSGYNNIVSSNEVYENYDFNIYISSGANSNIVRDNDIHDSDTDGGIYINHITTINNQLINNTVHDNYDEGIGIGIWSSVAGGNNSATNNTIYSNGQRGIFVVAENTTIYGNDIYNNNNYAIYLYTGANYANVTNNDVYNGLNRGIYARNIQNISVVNNYVYNHSSQGAYVSNVNHSIFRNNNITDNFKSSYGGNVEFLSSNFNTFEGNRFIGGNDFGIRAYSNFNNNEFRNNLFANSSDNLFYLGDGTAANNNSFYNCTFERDTSESGLYLNYADNTLVVDSQFSGAGNNVQTLGSNGNNTIFINTTWDNAYFAAGHTITRKWHLDIKVNTSDGDLENANVSLYNNTDIWEFSELTNASGWILRKNLTEYIYDGSTYTYYTNYTVNTTSPSASYGNNTREINLTSSIVEYITLGGLNDPPNNPTPLLTSIDGLNLTSSDLNCSTTISDPNSDLLNVSVRWYKNDVLNLTVDYNNSYTSGTLFNATIGFGNTTVGETWNCSIKLNDGEFDSGWGASNELNIIDTVPPVISWEDPTPSNGERINVSSVYLNASIVEGAFVSSFFDWNESLVGYWNFENYNSTGVYDNSSHDNFLTFSGSLGASSLVDSTYGSGMYFDGINDKLQRDWDSSLNKPTDGLTMSFWLKHNQMPNWDLKMLVARSYRTIWSDPYFEYGIMSDGLNSTHFTLGSRIDGTLHGNSDPVSYDEWHNIVLTWNGSSQDLIYYIDGVASGTDNQGVSEITYQYNGPLIVGLNLNNQEDLNGSIDEIAIFARTLGIDEIGEIYQNSDYSLEHNFTNLSGGNYTFRTHAIDLSGNYNVSSEREIVVNSQPIVFSAKITPTAAYTIDDLVGYCNATDVDNDNVTYYYEWYNDGILNNSGDSVLCANGHTNNGDGTCTVTLRPDSAGDLTEFPTATPSVAHYLNVDEIVADDDSTFVGSTADTSGTPTLKIALKENSVISVSPDKNLFSTFYTDSWEKGTRPSDSSQWTISDIDALQIGVNATTSLGVSNMDLFNLPTSNIPSDSTVNSVKIYERSRLNTRTTTNIRVTQVYVEVTYTAPIYYLPGVEININNLSNSLTTKGENWTFNCMAFDGFVNASSWVNESIIIQNSLPEQVSLDSPENGNTTMDRTPGLAWDIPGDDDSDSLTYHLFVNDSAGGIIYNQTGIATNSYTFSSDLALDDTYFWMVRANDSEEFGTWSNLWNFTVNSVVTISATTNSIAFGSLGPGVTANTSADSPPPFVLQNDGNSLLNISVNASQLFDQAALGTDAYQFKIDNTTETGSFSWLTSIINWFNMPTAAVVAIDSLKYEDSTDSVEIDILASVPTDELAGSKSSTVYFEASIAE